MTKLITAFFRKITQAIKKSPYKSIFSHGALITLIFVLLGAFLKLLSPHDINWTIGYVSIGFTLVGIFHLVHFELNNQIENFNALKKGGLTIGLWLIGACIFTLLFWNNIFALPIFYTTICFIAPFFANRGFSELENYPKFIPPVAKILEYASVKEVDLLDRTSYYIAFQIGKEQLIYSVKEGNALALTLETVFKVFLLYRNYNDKLKNSIPLSSISGSHFLTKNKWWIGNRYLDPSSSLKDNKLHFKKVRYDPEKKGGILINLIQIVVHPILIEQKNENHETSALPTT